jgi:hypothetical protein
MKEIIIDMLKFAMSIALITLPLWTLIVLFFNIKSDLIEAQRNLIKAQRQRIEILEEKIQNFNKY